ncbi:MAG: hypothetical protein B1H08_05185 [Candidatus Omnitrophica bacterium 4484_171]|nr:MAG: hypothetical protein B1H08_05185 [Candidatus Omnitrophica bacterium 4484_171]
MNEVYYLKQAARSFRWAAPRRTLLIRGASFFLLLFMLSFCEPVSAGGCPSAVVAKLMVKKVFNRDVNIVKIQHSPIAGLCQIQIKTDGKFQIIYTDAAGKYLIPASIFRVSDKSNLTKEKISWLNRFTPSQFKTLDSLTVFTAGAGKTIYFITDPQCPYCKKAESALKPLIDAKIIKVKFIIFPMPFHKGSKEQSISIVCDNKGLEGLMSQYRSRNQCQQGKDKIEKTILFLKHKRVTGVPTYIFPDGLYHSGAISEQELKRRLGII